MDHKHTPGPWTANPKHAARDNDGEIIIEQAGGSAPIATCYSINTLFNNDQAKANAALIAAAPDLLEALEVVTLCLAWHEERHGVGMYRKAVESARAAIAKATGGQNA